MMILHCKPILEIDFSLMGVHLEIFVEVIFPLLSELEKLKNDFLPLLLLKATLENPDELWPYLFCSQWLTMKVKSSDKRATWVQVSSTQ